MLKIYVYKNCDTCRKALKFLRSRGIVFEEIAIREKPPTLPELQAMAQAYPGELRKLFNTSGGDYKAMNLKDQLPGLSEAAALLLLSKNGNLIKRPFVVGPKIHLAGFDESRWKSAF